MPVAPAYQSPLAYMFAKPPPRKGAGISGLPAYTGDPFYQSPDNGQEVNESYRLLFPGNSEQRYGKKVEGYRKCQWAYTSNHSYSGCVDLITQMVLTNGISPGSKCWRLVPVLDDENDPIKDPDELQKAPFYRFTRTCNSKIPFISLLKQIVHDLTKCDTSFAELQLTKVINPFGIGQPGGLSLLAQDQMRVRVDEHGDLLDSKPFFQLREKQDPIDFDWYQILLLNNYGARGKGYLPQTPADKIEVPIYTSIEAELFIKSYFTSGAKMGMVFEHENWQKPQADAFLQWIKNRYTDTKNGHMPYMLWGGVTLHEAPSTISEFAEFIAIQQYDVRKICSIFGMDSRIISSPGEGNLGGKGEREQIWSEFLLRTVNPRKATISDQITEQILVQGFGITDWRFELIQFRDSKDSQSKTQESTTYLNMSQGGFINNERLADLITVRNAINPDLTDPTAEELATWPTRALRGTPDPAQADVAQLDENGNPIDVPPVKASPAPAVPGAAPVAAKPTPPPPAAGGRTAKRSARATEARVPRKAIKAHKSDWIASTTTSLKTDMAEVLKKSSDVFAKAYDLPKGDKMAAMMAIKNPFPTSGNVKSDMVRLFKEHFAASKAICEKELSYHASTMADDATAKGKRNSEQLMDTGPGGLADFIGSLGQDEFDAMYNDLLKMQRDTFRKGFTDGWSTDEFVAQLEANVPGYADTALERIVRTASTSLFTQARLQAGAESDVVDGYELSAIEDDRECEICEAGDGLQFPAHRKFPHPPFHPNCRCQPNYVLNGEDLQTDEGQLAEFKALLIPGYGAEA